MVVTSVDSARPQAWVHVVVFLRGVKRLGCRHILPDQHLCMYQYDFIIENNAEEPHPGRILLTSVRFSIPTALPSVLSGSGSSQFQRVASTRGQDVTRLPCAMP